MDLSPNVRQRFMYWDALSRKNNIIRPGYVPLKATSGFCFGQFNQDFLCLLVKIQGGHFIMTVRDLDVIQEKIDYKFNEPYILAQAFTRKSFAIENTEYQSNEQLEFVGDKVLDFIVVKKLAEMYSFKEEAFFDDKFHFCSARKLLISENI